MKIAIAEDDPRFAKQLEAYIEQFATENQFQVEILRFPDGASLVEAYDCTFDLLLLDVDMPGLDGISAARQIRERDTDVLLMFITNLAQYAIKGYEVDALDYVLKPVNYAALSMKLKRFCAFGGDGTAARSSSGGVGSVSECRSPVSITWRFMGTACAITRWTAKSCPAAGRP